MNKFKVGDEVEIVSHMNTVAKYGGASVISPIGTKDIISTIDEEEIELAGGVWSYHPQDLKLINKTTVGDKDEQSGSITSDGGSSSYYFTKLPKHLIDQIVETGGIEIKDIIRYVFDNDADAFNIVKAQKRIIESNKGKGKSGVTGLYDAKKITFFANEQYEAMKNKESK